MRKNAQSPGPSWMEEDEDGRLPPGKSAGAGIGEVPSVGRAHGLLGGKPRKTLGQAGRDARGKIVGGGAHRPMIGLRTASGNVLRSGP